MNSSTPIDQLNPAQRDAVRASATHQLILAGAGSGKTQVLVHRIAWLIQRHQVPPHAILAVTFTNKAAREMRGRIEEIAYLGSLTVYHLVLASGALLKAAQPNRQRHRDDELTWGDEVWAHWSRSAQVVLSR